MRHVRDFLYNNENVKYLRLAQMVAGYAIDWFMLFLGPCLIVLVFSIVSCELYSFFTVLLPFHAEMWTVPWLLNSAFACFLAVNILFNYVLCVCTNPGTHDSPVYLELLAQAKANGELNKHKPTQPRAREGVDRSGALDLPGVQQRRAGSGASGGDVESGVGASVGGGGGGSASSWIDQGDYEWGYCRRTKARKAPRAHYDHITKKLVLNMDHYCPWMFNVVGCLNYRYFFLFLAYVLTACVYGLLLTSGPFLGLLRSDRDHGRKIGNVGRGGAFSARSATIYTFVLALSIGLAVGLLFAWHLYLALSAQTTIEFYGNQTKAYRARARGLRYRNPYDLGSMRRNWEQLMGPLPLYLAVLPSTRRPPLPPWPSLSDGRFFLSPSASLPSLPPPSFKSSLKGAAAQAAIQDGHVV